MKEPGLSSMYLLLPWVFFLRVGGSLAFLAFNFFLAISLPHAEVGLYFFGTAVVVILSTLGRCGTDSVMVAEISGDNNEKKHSDCEFNKYLIVVSFACLLFVALSYVALSIVGEFFNVALKIRVLEILLLSVFPLSVSVTYSEFFKAKEKPVFSVIFRFVLIPVLLLVFGGCFDLMSNVYELSRLYVCISCVVCLSAVAVASPYSCSMNLTYPQVLSVITASSPLLLVALCGLFIGWWDLAILGLWYGPEIIANYGVATKISTLFTFVGTAVLTIYSPIISKKIDSSDWLDLSRLLRKIMVMSLLAGGMLLLFVIFYGEEALSFIGGEYEGAYELLVILCIAQCINVAFGPVGFVLVKFGLGKLYAKAYVSIVLLMVPEYVVLVPAFGPIAAAIMALIMFSLINVLCVFYINKKTHLKLFS